MKHRKQGLLLRLFTGALAAVLCTTSVSAAQCDLPPQEESVEQEVITQLLSEGPLEIVGQNVIEVLEGEAQDWEVYGETAAPAASIVTEDGLMYNQLTPRQQDCYNEVSAMDMDEILTAPLQGNVYTLGVRLNSFYGILLTGSYQNNQMTVSEASKGTEKEIFGDLYRAIEALRFDRPDALWLKSMTFGYRWSTSDNTTFKVTDVTFGFRLLENGREKQLWEETMAQVNRIASTIDTTQDRYTQVKEIYAYLASINTYNHEPEGDEAKRMSHQAYSALIPGDAYEPVCDGYAKAFMLVCRELAIPCTLAVSKAHMWNNVRMDDDEWYNVDLTWEDTDDQALSYTYFLVGSRTEVGGVPFQDETDHVEQDPCGTDDKWSTVSLAYPEKNPKAYVYLGAPYPQRTFPDVRWRDWFYQAVDQVYALGVLKGDNNGNFRPQSNITRGEFAQAIANSQQADLSNYTGTSFLDVSEGDWFAPAVAWVKEKGLMSGAGDYFRPKDSITREEICVVLYNLTRTLSGGQLEDAPENNFPDKEQIASWARKAVNYCAQQQVVMGDSNGNFNPKSSARRCEVATIFVRYLALPQVNA